MPNVRDDVLLVQTLLKLANFKGNGKGEAANETSCTIEVDGCFGEQTKRLIESFEACVREKHLLLTADGVIEPSSPDGYTPEGVIYKIIHLNRFARQATQSGNRYDLLPIDPGIHPGLRQSLSSEHQAFFE